MIGRFGDELLSHLVKAEKGGSYDIHVDGRELIGKYIEYNTLSEWKLFCTRS